MFGTEQIVFDRTRWEQDAKPVFHSSGTSESFRAYPFPPGLLFDDALNQEIRDKFIALTRHPYHEGVYELHDMCVFDNWGMIRKNGSENSPNFLPGFGWNNDHTNHLINQNFLSGDLNSNDASLNYAIQEEKSLPGTSIMLSFPGGLTFGHWFFDVVGRYLALSETQKAEAQHVLLPAPWAKWMDRFIPVLNIPKSKIRPLNKYTLYRTERLLVPTVPSQAPGGAVSHGIMKQILSAFGYLFQNWAESAKPPESDIILLEHTAMTSGQARVLQNTDALAHELQARGFKTLTINPLQQSFADTLRCIQGTRLCIGQDSSALHNLICTPKDLLVIETEKRRNLLHMCVQAAAQKKIGYLDAHPQDDSWHVDPHKVGDRVANILKDQTSLIE